MSVTDWHKLVTYKHIDTKLATNYHAYLKGRENTLLGNASTSII